MDFYNVYNDEYLALCKSPVLHKTVRLCVLDYCENVLYAFTKDVDSVDGSVTVNYSQGVRRSCSITVADIQHEYLPNEDSPFWFGRKFKIYTGLASNGGNVYWFSQGVFICKDARITNYTIALSGVDKFGMFTDDLSFNTLQGSYTIKNTSHIYDAVVDLLALDNGNGTVLDPIDPYMDNQYYTAKVPYDVVVNEGETLGALLIDIATSLGADVYYDTEGHLSLTQNYSEDFNNYDMIYEFGNRSTELLSLSATINYASAVNTVTVFGTNEDGRVFRHTATNDYATSPIRVSLIGTKACAPIESDMCYDRNHCKQYADYELRRQAMTSVDVELECTEIPHLDVNKLITITDESLDYKNEEFIIQSITIPLGLEATKISCCNTVFLANAYETDSCSL